MSPTPTSTATPTAPTAMVHSYYLPLLIS
jgi:hypothetical protein